MSKKPSKATKEPQKQRGIETAVSGSRKENNEGGTLVWR